MQIIVEIIIKLYFVNLIKKVAIISLILCISSFILHFKKIYLFLNNDEQELNKMINNKKNISLKIADNLNRNYQGL